MMLKIPCASNAFKPDLSKSSIPHRMKRTLLIAGVALLVLSAILLMVGVFQFIMPPTFESVGRISIQPEKNEMSDNELWLQTEMERLQSKTVLYHVITNLELNQKWGAKFKEGELRTEVTYALLRQQLELRPVPETQFIEIRVQSDDPMEAAAIANDVAVTYSEQKRRQESELSFKEMRALEAELPKLGIRIQALEDKLKHLGAKLDLAIDSAQPQGLQQDDPRAEFHNLQRELENLTNERKKAMVRLDQEKIESGIIKDYNIQMPDHPAEPNFHPVRPHPLMKKLVPFAGLLAGVLGVVILMLGMMMNRSAKKSPPSLPA